MEEKYQLGRAMQERVFMYVRTAKAQKPAHPRNLIRAFTVS